MLLFSYTITPRLQYVTDFVSSQLLEEPIRLTTSETEFNNYNGPRINYSGVSFSESEYYLQPHSLLFENDVRLQAITCFEVNFNKAFFQTRGDFSFDVLAATFYLISRYEEYLPHEKDEYGRYSHKNALAWKENFLQLPLINYWLHDLKRTLAQKFPQLIFKRQQFKFIPTYDIDIAYAYLHKGWKRNTGGLIRSLYNGEWSEVMERITVLQRKKKDPFDAYEWLDALHLYCRVKPLYFFLVAQHQKGYDKNIPTSSHALQELITYLSKHYIIGVHPSWQSSISESDHMIKEEKEWLEVVADKNITNSRQHYIKFSLPGTYRQLIAAGIHRDYSMGYGTVNGFRASVAASFNWFDLEKNEATPLQVFPFCFMDANAYYEQQYTAWQAYYELKQYYTMLKKLNGLLITIWHNHFLGASRQFSQWKEVYALFMKEDVYWDAFNN
jgi:hypothetical protein